MIKLNDGSTQTEQTKNSKRKFLSILFKERWGINFGLHGVSFFVRFHREINFILKILQENERKETIFN